MKFILTVWLPPEMPNGDETDYAEQFERMAGEARCTIENKGLEATLMPHILTDWFDEARAILEVIP